MEIIIAWVEKWGKLRVGDIKVINCWVNIVPKNISYYQIEVLIK